MAVRPLNRTTMFSARSSAASLGTAAATGRTLKSMRSDVFTPPHYVYMA